VWKEVFRGHVRVSGVWKEFFGGFATVTNITVSHSNTGTALCRIRFNRDGSIDVGTGTGGSPTWVQTHAGEWWSNEPNQIDIGDDFEVRCQSVTTGDPDTTWSVQAAAVGTYIVISASREWGCTAQGGKIGPNTKAITVSSFQIRRTGGAVEDTWNMSITAIRTA